MPEIKIAQDTPFARTWQNIKMETTHKKELSITCLLNKQLCKEGLRARRVQGDPYSLYDIEVMVFDYTSLKFGALICRIDLESKPDRFPENGVPDRYKKRGVSFLVRKTKKIINFDRDVYLLFDSHIDYPRVIWAPYKIIRDYSEYEFFGTDNEFLVIRPKEWNRLYYRLSDLVHWCNILKNSEVSA